MCVTRRELQGMSELLDKLDEKHNQLNSVDDLFNTYINADESVVLLTEFDPKDISMVVDEMNSTCSEDYKQFVNSGLLPLIKKEYSPVMEAQFNAAFKQEFIRNTMPCLSNVMAQLNGDLQQIVDIAYERMKSEVDSIGVTLDDDKKGVIHSLMKDAMTKWTRESLLEEVEKRMGKGIDDFMTNAIADIATDMNTNHTDNGEVLCGTLEKLSDEMEKLFVEVWTQEIGGSVATAQFEKKKSELNTQLLALLDPVAFDAKRAIEKRKRELLENLRQETLVANLPNVPTTPVQLTPSEERHEERVAEAE